MIVSLYAKLSLPCDSEGILGAESNSHLPMAGFYTQKKTDRLASCEFPFI